MLYPFNYFDHRRDCRRKQDERKAKITNLPQQYHQPVSSRDRDILGKTIEELVQDVHKGLFEPVDILRSYGKVAISAHYKTNCLTEVMLPEAESWAKSDVNLKGPLAGIPVSLKDTINVRGFDSSVGYSCKTGKPHAEDGAIVQILKDAGKPFLPQEAIRNTDKELGAIPYVKTNIPITLLSFESNNDVWGRCTNPHDASYTPGGSTGGEAALLAFGGGRIGIGSDVAGSVRVPAHFSGIYALRCSIGRWPKLGMSTSMPGQEGVQSVYSPMARTLADLTYFTRSMVSMKPWNYDYSVHPLAWRDSDEEEILKKKSLRIGVMYDDGVVTSTPACARALSLTTAALSAAGHTVLPLTPPSPLTALRLCSQLLFPDAGTTFLAPFRASESQDPGVAQLLRLARLPFPLRYLYYLYTKYIRRDSLYASLILAFRQKSVAEQWALVAEREAYKAEWHAWWTAQQIDLLVTVPNATPAVPHGGMRDAVSACGYTVLFNLLDYTAGVLPVTKVDRDVDKLDAGVDVGKMNAVARGAYRCYDAEKMHGLPVGVQVVGRRLQEERVLAGMRRVEDALRAAGVVYAGLEIE